MLTLDRSINPRAACKLCPGSAMPTASVLEAPLLLEAAKLKISPQQQQQQQQHLDESSSRIFTVAKLAGSFFFVYSAMDALSEYITSVLPNGLGDESLVCLQAALCVATLVAPTIVSYLGELRGMMLGGAAHVLYLACLVKPCKYLVLASSVLCGFGASLTWVSQGTFLTRCSPPSKRGLYAGIFWGIYYFSGIVGNLAAFLIFKYLSQASMFGAGSVSAAVGVLLLLLVDDCEEGEPGEGLGCRTTPEAQKSNSCNEILRFLLLLPITFYLGCQAAFCTGEFTKLLPPESIGMVLLFTGLGQVVGAFLLSWLSDFFRCGTPTFLLGSVSSAAGLLMCVPLHEHRKLAEDRLGVVIFGAPALAYVAGILFGIADGVVTSHVFSLTGRVLQGRKPEIWAFFNLLGTAGSAATLWTGIVAPIRTSAGLANQIWMQMAILILGTPFYTMLDVWSACARRPCSVSEFRQPLIVDGGLEPLFVPS